MRLAAAALVAALALAGCGDSPEDDARRDGKDMGEAVRALHDAQSVEEAQAAVGELRTAAEDLTEDVRGAVSDQVETQKETLSSAADAFRAGEPDELRAVIGDIRAQAQAFGESGDSVANEFWRGFEEGYEG